MTRIKSDGGSKTVGIEAGADIDLEAATGSTSGSLQFGLVRQACESLWIASGLAEAEIEERVKTAMAALEAIAPEDEIEGMLGVQMVGTHNAAMECLRRAMLPGQTFEGRDQNLKHAGKLLSLYARQVEVLDKRRGRGQQKVTVEHVHVEAGGQAIVGNVHAGASKSQSKSQHEAIPHAPEVPYAAPAPAVTRKKRQRR